MPDSRQLLASCREHALRQGFELFGVVRAQTFDRCQPAGRRVTDLAPGAGTALVIGHGGPAGWERMVEVDGEPGSARPGHDPIDAFSRRTGEELVHLLADAGCEARVVLPSDRCTLNFLQLGEESGFGTISPAIGLLVHPRFGPWVSLRAAILVQGQPFGDSAWSHSIACEYQPCTGCKRPCLEACPADAYTERGFPPDLDKCISHRQTGGCTRGCDVRRACPVGADYRYGPDEERFRHSYSLFAMRRMFGLGWWRFVPAFLRSRC